MNNIGKRIRDLREKKGLSLIELAKILNISVPSLSRIETGVTDVNISRLKQIALILETSISNLFTLELDEQKRKIEEEIIVLRIKLLETSNQLEMLQQEFIRVYELMRINSARKKN